MQVGRSVWLDAGLLVLRLGFGLGFLFYHGWGKITGGPERWGAVGSAVEHLGIGFGHTFFGFLAALAESVGGLALALGLFFRPMVLALAVTMFVAATMHVRSGRGTPAHAAKNLFVFLGLALTGPGRFSVDAWLASRRRLAAPRETGTA